MLKERGREVTHLWRGRRRVLKRGEMLKLNKWCWPTCYGLGVLETLEKDQVTLIRTFEIRSHIETKMQGLSTASSLSALS